MADTNNNIIIDINGNTASMATDFGLASGISLGTSHVPLSKLVWGDSDYGYRTDLINPLPVQLAGQTGEISITGYITGKTGAEIPFMNYVDSASTATGPHGVTGLNYIAVAGSTNGSTPIGISGHVQGITNGVPIEITGSSKIAGAMAIDAYGIGGTFDAISTVRGVLIQGTSAGNTATVAGESFPGYGFGVPVAVTAGRRLHYLQDSIEVTGSVNVLGDRELVAATDSVSVYGYDGGNVVHTMLCKDRGGTTAGFSGDALKVSIVDASISATVNVSATTGVTNDSATVDTDAVPGALKIQGITGGAPVMVKGQNGGALEVVSTSGLNTIISGTVTISDTNIVNSLESTSKPLITALNNIKAGTDKIKDIKTDLTSGKGVKAIISSIVKPDTIRSGSKTYTTPVVSQLHNNLELKTGVTIKLSPSSTVNVLVGNRNLVNNNNNGYLLEPGESIYLEVNNVNKIYAKQDTTVSDHSSTVYYIGS